MSSSNDAGQRRRMSNNGPAWFTPWQQAFPLFREHLDACPVGTTLEVPAGLAVVPGAGDVVLSVRKVSSRKWSVTTARGSDRLGLVGLPGKLRQRRENNR